MRKAKIPPLEVPPPIRKGAWQIARENDTGGMPTRRTSNKQSKVVALNDDVLFQMAKEKAGGATLASLAAKYQVSETYINEALKKLYLSSAKGKQILRGVLLENAIGTGMHGRAKIGELNGMQAIVASGIMTQRFIDLDKYMQSTPETVDVAEIEKVGRLIIQLESRLEGVDLLAGDKTMDDVIDVSAQVL